MVTVVEQATVVGVFTNRADAQRAVKELKRAGFRDEEIGIATRDGQPSSVATGLSDGDRVAAAATAGAIAGGAGGALWGIGIAAGLLPGIGPVIAGGTLAAILASAATGAAAAGLAGAFIGLGLPEEEAQHYQTEFNAGRSIVTVHATGERFLEAQHLESHRIDAVTGAIVSRIDEPFMGAHRTQTDALVSLRRDNHALRRR